MYAIRSYYDVFGGGNPLNAMTQLTQRNLEIWKEIQESFLKSAGLSSSKPKENAADKEADKS